MSKALTTGSTIVCNHGGTAALSSSAKLRVSGNPVLLEDQVSSFGITKCTQTADKQKQCGNIVTVTGGPSTKLKVGGVAVVLETLAGETDGVPDTGFKVTAGQTKLDAP